MASKTMSRPSSFLRRASSPCHMPQEPSVTMASTSVATPPLPSNAGIGRDSENNHSRPSSPALVSTGKSPLLSVPHLADSSGARRRSSSPHTSLEITQASSITGTSPSSCKPISIRPARFIKAANMPSSTTHLSESMASFVQSFEAYSHKLYIEGYLMRHNDPGSNKKRTRCFVELSGPTLTLWDAELQMPSVMPHYVNVADANVVSLKEGEVKKKHVFSLQLKSRTILFEGSDESTLQRWIAAIRLAGYEYVKFHQLFTHRLLKTFPPSLTPATGTTTTLSGFLQVRSADTTEWQRYWAVVTDKKDERRLFSSKKSVVASSPSPSLHGHTATPTPSSSSSYISSNLHHQLLLYETKKSKQPLMTLSCIYQAYAVYPEAPQLIEKSSIMRVEDRDTHLFLMADTSTSMQQWLLAIYDVFKLHGRPQTLMDNTTDPAALNFAEPIQGHAFPLQADDALRNMNTHDCQSRLDIEQFFNDCLQSKLQQPLIVTSRPSANSRAKSLPLITVACEGNSVPELAGQPDPTDSSQIHPTDPAAEVAGTTMKFARQVADSSDESDNDTDEEDEEEDEDEQDSDDEPIGKKQPGMDHPLFHSSKTPSASSSSALPTSAADSLIPDFDFGNGFDVSADERSRHRASSTSSFAVATTTSSEDDTRSNGRQPSMSVNHSSSSSSAASTSLFGDFSLSTDFGKYLDQPTLRREFHRRPSGEQSSRRSSSGHAMSFDRRRSSWAAADYDGWHGDGGDEEEEEDEEGEGEGHARHPYDDDEHSYESDFDGPLIPSLGDHFAPQNSLLDNYLGEQLSAKEQIEYARATGQPLIQVPAKPSAPNAGLVGMISQREKNRKEGNGARVSERVQQHQAELGHIRFEREKERRILEQRQQQFMKHQVILFCHLFSTELF
ncbi:uncharacterized protein BYT42DRAFT_574267 [Radiomyces spectabilis]|uniref:uncharacterized protein n=1 Tax=Radiomyces spectabilis TaxID=64574 RepID=UPI00221EC04E|nr:uncharacterized protein BYT42DRAFT_574267 [Radiomyces spectabilis]KAI8376336.1 hypothetical protein BYT42DRAFT_574267 [Radiomyces spectabilis]